MRIFYPSSSISIFTCRIVVILLCISLPLPIYNCSADDLSVTNEDTYCEKKEGDISDGFVGVAGEINEDIYHCTKDEESVVNAYLQKENSPLDDFLESSDTNRLFDFLDENKDGIVNQEELVRIFLGKETEKATKVHTRNLFFLLGKLVEDSVNKEELGNLRFHGIQIESDNFRLFIRRVIAKNLVTHLIGENLERFFKTFDVDKNEKLSQDEQFEAAKAIFAFPQRGISKDSISSGLEKVELVMECKELKFTYLDNFLGSLRWTNALIFYTLQIHYEAYHQNILTKNDFNKDGFLTQGEAYSIFKSSGCIPQSSIYQLISRDEMESTDVFCSGDEISNSLQALEFEMDSEIFSFDSGSKKSVMKLQQEFWQLSDSDSNSYLTFEELKESLNNLSGTDGKLLEITAEELFSVDANADKIITIHELHRFLLNPPEQGQDRWINALLNSNHATIKIPEHIYQAFKLFDEDLNGKINFKELRLTREIQYLYIRKLWIEFLMKIADTNGNGNICVEEFFKFLSFRNFNLPDDICRVREEEGNYKQVFEQIDANTDGSIDKTELYDMVKYISKSISETNEENNYLFHVNEQSSDILCSLFWNDFVVEMKQNGHEKIDFTNAEKDFYNWDTNSDKWLNFTEYESLFETSVQKGVDTTRLVEWLKIWLQGKLDYYTEEFLEDFEKQDDNKDGIISKGEIIKILQNHRKDYYTNERVNVKFSRSDRNEDGYISMAEYYFLTLLKVRRPT